MSILEQRRYGMRVRPYSIGCQPKDGLAYVEQSERGDTIYRRKGEQKYWNILVYNRTLTKEELTEYELDDLGPQFLCSTCDGSHCPEEAFPQEQHCEGYRRKRGV